MPRPLTATIHVSALTHNLDVARKHAPRSKTWAVVKANAYGHGLERAMRGFAASEGLALVEPDAAEKLRELGWKMTARRMQLLRPHAAEAATTTALTFPVATALAALGVGAAVWMLVRQFTTPSR